MKCLYKKNQQQHIGFFFFTLSQWFLYWKISCVCYCRLSRRKKIGAVNSSGFSFFLSQWFLNGKLTCICVGKLSKTMWVHIHMELCIFSASLFAHWLQLYHLLIVGKNLFSFFQVKSFTKKPKKIVVLPNNFSLWILLYL